MNLANLINITFGSCLITILIFIDYLHKKSTDLFQRRLFCSILVFSFCSMLVYIFHSILSEIPGRLVSFFAYAFDNIYFVFQLLAYFYIFIFVDYIISKEPERTKKITIAAWIVLLIFIFVFLIDFWSRLQSNLSPNKIIWQKSEKYVKSAICYLPMLLMICDFFTSHREEKKARKNMVFLFAGITFAGFALDTVFGTANLLWPCLTAALLYTYFIIIRTDIQIDSLTGIGNRYSFNEFIDRLSRLNIKESYAIVMIDMDHLKEINDTLGHQEGDNALKDMASIIKRCIRSSDFSARYGGDEFVLATNAKYEIDKLMGRIQQAVDEQNEKRIRPFKLQISYG